MADFWDWLGSGDNADAKKFQEQIYGGLRDYVGKADENAYYKGPTYAGAGPTTKAGWNMATGYANRSANGAYGDAVNGATGYFNDMIGQGGLSGDQRYAKRQVGGLWGAYGGLGDHGGLNSTQSDAQGQLGNLYGRYGDLGDNGGLTFGQGQNVRTADQAGRSYQQLQKDYAAGNPFFERDLANANDKAGAAVNSAIGVSGRFGSGGHVDQLARTIGNLDNSARAQQRDNAFNYVDRSLQGQLGASGQAFGERQQGVGNQMSAYGAQAGLAQNRFNNAQTGTNNQFNALNGQMNSANTRFGMDQQGFNNQLAGAAALPGLYDAGLKPSQTLGAIGAAKDTNRQGLFNEQQDAWNRQRYAPLDFYGRVAGVGATAAGGVPTTGNNTPGWMQAVGAAGSIVPWFMGA